MLSDIEKELNKKFVVDLNKTLEAEIVSRGDKVAINTPECINWKEHNNNSCCGCPSELGCEKIIKVIRLLLLPLEPRRFYDYKDWRRETKRYQEDIDELIQHILNAKNIEELKATDKRLDSLVDL